jgi:hypothetical protein
MEHNVGASQEQRRSRDDGAIRASDVDAGQIKKERREKEEGGVRREDTQCCCPSSNPCPSTSPARRQDKIRQDKTKEEKTRQDKKDGPITQDTQQGGKT